MLALGSILLEQGGSGGINAEHQTSDGPSLGQKTTQCVNNAALT